MSSKGAGGNSRIASVAVIAASLALASCSDVDDALFGPYPSNGAARPIHAEDAIAPPVGEQASAAPAEAPPSEAPEAAPSEAAPAPEAPPPPEAMAPPPPAHYGNLGPRIASVQIEPVRQTGTPLGTTAASLHDQVVGIQTKLLQNAGQLGKIRTENAGLISRYQNTRAQIATKLQIGSAPADPELVAAWNSAQEALDKLATNINATAAIGNEATSQSSAAQQIVQQLTNTSATAGGSDTDRAQLGALQDETQQLIISIERLRKEVAVDAPKETAFLANERADLVQLQSAIKAGQPLGASTAPVAHYAAMPAPAASGGAPIAVIKFDSAHVDYQQTLYAALTQALQTKPSAAFEVLAVAPTGENAAAMAAAQNSAKQHARDVLATMTQMGVPAARVAVASVTDPSVQKSEVRVFVQ